MFKLFPVALLLAVEEFFKVAAFMGTGFVVNDPANASRVIRVGVSLPHSLSGLLRFSIPF